MHKVLLMSLCVLSLHVACAQTPNKDRMVRYDDRNDYTGSHFDYSAMMLYSSKKLEQFAPHLEALVNAQDGQSIMLSGQDEQADFVIAYAYFIIALFRMRQEAACVLDEQAAEIPSKIWSSTGPIFSVFEKELRLEALGEVIEYIQEHGDDAWQATEHLELYRPSSEWSALRADVSQNFEQFLKNVANSLQ